MRTRRRVGVRDDVLLATDQIDISVWRRTSGDTWHYTHVIDDPSATIALPEFGTSLAVSDIYIGADIKPVTRPRLVWPDDSSTR